MNLTGILSSLTQNTTTSVQTQNQNTEGNQGKNTLTYTSGQTLSGKVLSFSNGQISLSVNGAVINGNVNSDLSFSNGQQLTFLVKQGENGQTILAPLYENTANSQNVSQALLAANLPLTAQNQFMVSRMMTEGLPVNKDAITTMFSNLQKLGNANLEEAIGLTKLGIAVNEENAVQYKNYQELTHALTKGMTEILLELPDFYDTLVEEGNVEQANTFEKNFLSIFLKQNTENIPLENENSTMVPTENSSISENVKQLVNLSNNVEELLTDESQVKGVLQNEMGKEGVLQEGMENQSVLSQNEMLELKNVLSELQVKTGDFSNQQSGFEILKSVLDGLDQELSGKDLSKLFHNQGFQKLVSNLVEEQWLTKPENVGKPGNMKELYHRLFEQTNELSKALGSVDGSQNHSFTNHVENMRANLEFMNQINQFSTYIQLPLKMEGQNGNGDLYVFTNKKSLANKDGNVTALLHLDMEQLGPMDVFVAMINQNVKTKFYLANEETIDLIAENVHLLNERLEARGYQINAEVLPRDAMKEEGIEDGLMNHLLQKSSTGNVSFDPKGFDVKA